MSHSLNGEIIVDACTRGCRNIRKACTPVVLKIEDLIRNYLGLSRDDLRIGDELLHSSI